jgi:hypothetical protein
LRESGEPDGGLALGETFFGVRSSTLVEEHREREVKCQIKTGKTKIKNFIKKQLVADFVPRCKKRWPMAKWNSLRNVECFLWRDAAFHIAKIGGPHQNRPVGSAQPRS